MPVQCNASTQPAITMPMIHLHPQIQDTGYYNKAVLCLHQHQKVCVVLRHICHSLKPPHNVESISFIALARRLKAWFWWDLCGVVLCASQGVVSSCCCRIVRGVEKAKKGLGWAVQCVLYVCCFAGTGEVTWGILVNRKCYTECLCLGGGGCMASEIQGHPWMTSFGRRFYAPDKTCVEGGMRYYNCMHPTNHRRPVHSSVCRAWWMSGAAR